MKPKTILQLQMGLGALLVSLGFVFWILDGAMAMSEGRDPGPGQMAIRLLLYALPSCAVGGVVFLQAMRRLPKL